MTEFFKMPKLGMDMDEGVVVHWLKKEGEEVKKGEPFVEIETDKSMVEVESPISGTVLKLYYAEGDVIAVNQPIAAVGIPGDSAPDLLANTVSEQLTTPHPATEPVKGDVNIPANSENRKLRSSPRARKLAENNHVNLTLVTPTGPSDRIIERDVRTFLANMAPAIQDSVADGRSEQVVPFTGFRKVIANRMHQSLAEMAQANHRMDVNMTAMIALRKQFNADPRLEGTKISFVDLLVRTCAAALQDCPEANASLQPDGLHLRNFVNIGVAVAADRGLVVPVIHDVDLMSLKEISQKSKALIEKARNGSLQPDEMKWGTFTLTNLGMYDIDSFTAIVNPPEVCILAIGRIAEKVVVEDGQMVIRPIMNLSLSYDHRILDGAPAAQFLRKIKYYIENPIMMFV